MSSAISSNRQSGFTLFVALLVSSLMLAIGFSIGNIILKQIAISSSGGGSLNAFYAADSAVECAMFWDRKNEDGTAAGEGAFGPNTDGAVAQSTVKCGNEVYINNKTVFSADNVTTYFTIDYSDAASTYYACAYVTVTKNYNVGGVEGQESTQILVEGYNTEMATNPDSTKECNITRPRVVGRGLLQSY